MYTNDYDTYLLDRANYYMGGSEEIDSNWEKLEEDCWGCFSRQDFEEENWEDNSEAYIEHYRLARQKEQEEKKDGSK